MQFRLGSTAATTTMSSILGRSLSNKERSEHIRKTLGYTKIPVLRNRKRALFFVESDALGGFGPGANFGPPEEMSPGEMYNERTGRGQDDVGPKLRIDWSESLSLEGSNGSR